MCFHGHGLSVLYKNRIWYLQYFDLTRSEWDDTMCLNQCIEYRIEVHQPKSNPLEAPGHGKRRKGGDAEGTPLPGSGAPGRTVNSRPVAISR